MISNRLPAFKWRWQLNYYNSIQSNESGKIEMYACKPFQRLVKHDKEILPCGDFITIILCLTLTVDLKKAIH